MDWILYGYIEQVFGVLLKCKKLLKRKKDPHSLHSSIHLKNRNNAREEKLLNEVSNTFQSDREA